MLLLNSSSGNEGEGEGYAEGGMSWVELNKSWPIPNSAHYLKWMSFSSEINVKCSLTLKKNGV